MGETNITYKSSLNFNSKIYSSMNSKILHSSNCKVISKSNISISSDVCVKCDIDNNKTNINNRTVRYDNRDYVEIILEENDFCLAPNQSVTIDCETMSVILNYENGLKYMTNGSKFFQLVNGLNYLSVKLNPYELQNPNVSVNVRYNKKYR